MRKIVNMFLAVLLLSFVLIGCGVSEDKPISDATKEAQTMSINQLKAIISKYENAIQSKKADIEKLAAKLQEIPIAQIMGEESGKLKNDIQKIKDSIKALTDRLNVYTQELKSKM